MLGARLGLLGRRGGVGRGVGMAVFEGPLLRLGLAPAQGESSSRNLPEGLRRRGFPVGRSPRADVEVSYGPSACGPLRTSRRDKVVFLSPRPTTTAVSLRIC